MPPLTVACMVGNNAVVAELLKHRKLNINYQGRVRICICHLFLPSCLSKSVCACGCASGRGGATRSRKTCGNFGQEQVRIFKLVQMAKNGQALGPLFMYRGRISIFSRTMRASTFVGL